MLGLGVHIPSTGAAGSMMLPPVASITWPGTASPALTLGDITLPSYTATWPGTSSPTITVT